MSAANWKWSILKGSTNTITALKGSKGINESIHIHLDGRIMRWEGLCETTTHEFKATISPFASCEVYNATGEEMNALWRWVEQALQQPETRKSYGCDSRDASYRQDLATGVIW